MSARIAIFASGEGTTAQSLLDASARDELAGARVVVVVADRPGAGVLDRASRAGVEALVISSGDYADRAEWGDALLKEIQSRGIDLICSAGLMKLLPPGFVRAFPNRILNTHAALLPSFAGTHPARDALEWGVKVTGATVHFVDEQTDHGPIILQESVRVTATDDEASLHERIKVLERRLYPEAVRAVVSERVRIEGRIVHVEGSNEVTA